MVDRASTVGVVSLTRPAFITTAAAPRRVLLVEAAGGRGSEARWLTTKAWEAPRRQARARARAAKAAVCVSGVDCGVCWCSAQEGWNNYSCCWVIHRLQSLAHQRPLWWEDAW